MIGGAEIFALFLPLADRIELTEIHAAPEGDTLMPAFHRLDRNRARRSSGRGGRPAYSFVTLAPPPAR